MNELTLEALLRTGNSEYAQEDADYMIIKVGGPTPVPEIIVNPKANFVDKLNYYSMAYNNDLTLKANPNIKIMDYHFVPKEHMGRFNTFAGV